MQVQAANTGVFLLQESIAVLHPALSIPSLATGQCGWQLRQEMRTLRALKRSFQGLSPREQTERSGGKARAVLKEDLI